MDFGFLGTVKVENYESHEIVRIVRLASSKTQNLKPAHRSYIAHVH